MDTEQITNIAIRIGEFSQKANDAAQDAETARWVAVLSVIAAIISTLLSCFMSWKINHLNQEHEKRLNDLSQSHEKRLNEMDKEHQKQWAYVSKTSLLIDDAIQIFSRMLFNKIILAHREDSEAANNLFLLQKDILVIESQLVVYASQELADAVFDYKNLILGTPNDQFLAKWPAIYQKGNEILVLCRKFLAGGISEEFRVFAERLVLEPILEQTTSVVASATTMGTLNLSERKSVKS